MRLSANWCIVRLPVRLPVRAVGVCRGRECGDEASLQVRRGLGASRPQSRRPARRHRAADPAPTDPPRRPAAAARHGRPRRRRRRRESAAGGGARRRAAAARRSCRHADAPPPRPGSRPLHAVTRQQQQQQQLPAGQFSQCSIMCRTHRIDPEMQHSRTTAVYAAVNNERDR